MAHTPDPMTGLLPTEGTSVSKEVHIIAGIKCSVYGLAQIPSSTSAVSVLWLLHPRLSSQERMEALANEAINRWNARFSQASSDDKKHNRQGLIAVSFDQRNHGTRLQDKLANEAWRGGNPRHAQDMFSIYHGTSLDVSQLITYLPAYAFPAGAVQVLGNAVLGVSLGGHAAWLCGLHDPRITTAISVIGCADYAVLMRDRAVKSRLESAKGPGFLGSVDFPDALLRAVELYDPAGLLAGEVEDLARRPSAREERRLMPLMKAHLQGKRIFQLSGGSDKLVPYACSEPFLRWLKEATGPAGWFVGQGTVVRDRVYEGAGHEMTPKMAADAMDFLMEGLEAQAQSVGKTGSKM